MPAHDKDVELNERIMALGGTTDALYSSNGVYDTPEALRRIHELEARQREARMEQLQKDSVDIAKRALRASWAAVIASAVAILVSIGAAFL